MRVAMWGVGRWLMPWVCVTAVAGALAYAADQGLERVLIVPDPPPVQATPLRQIEIVYFHPDRPSTAMVCMAEAARDAADVLMFSDPREVLDAISELCLTPAEPIDMTARAY